MPQMGRFTLRDEGKTIAVGKILRYKPARDNGLTVVTSTGGAKSQEEAKVGGATSSTTTAVKEELVYDMDTGETISREEFNKRKQAREKAELAGIAEGDEDEDEETAKKNSKSK